MGFGLLALGYFTMLGIFPTSPIYVSYAILIPVLGGGIMFAAFRKLQVYNIYFKVMKYICGVYILILAAFAPFEIIYFNSMQAAFIYVSKPIKILILFAFHYFLLYAINSLAKEINNPRIKRASQRNIYATYFYFSVSVLSLFPIFGSYTIHLQLFSMIFGIIYYFLILINLFLCYVGITTE